WVNYRDEYLDESLRAEGRSPYIGDQTCRSCHRGAPADVRCRECVGGELTCSECACRRHVQMPLHKMERWTGSFFVRVELIDLGLVVQLGHPPGIACAYRSAPRKEFTVLHTNGIHKVRLYFCGCGACEGVPQWKQLRRFGWWPATPLEPQTAATCQVLKQFHLLSLQGKVTAYDYYRTLVLLTDNTGLVAFPDRLSSFMNIIRQYRHIQMVKRGGRGHALEGISGARPGECAVLCPACPQPGLNLPENWQEAAPDKQWLFRRIIAMDANFRLKNRLRSSAALDPGFHTGLAYFIEEEGYNAHVSKYATQEEISTCSGFAAVANANTKNTKGLRATGVGAVSCAKHEFWMPIGMGDLQRGERYCNMDYIFWSSMQGLKNSQLLVSYDIACQWSKNFWERTLDAPPGLQLDLPHDAVDFAIPKFHLPAHHAPCQVPYSLNYKLGVGITDGEAPERNWAALNGAAYSTKEMGPGARHDTLDDHCGNANWRRVANMGASIVRRMKTAVLNATEHVEVFEDFTSHLIVERAEQVRDWIRAVEDWDRGMGDENPYFCEKDDATLPEVRLELAREEAERASEGLLDAAGPGRPAFLLLGMDIEEMQSVMLINASRYAFSVRDSTALQEVQTQESRTAILRQIFKFRTEQEARMPNVGRHFEIDDNAEASTPETIRLYLPSDIPAEDRNRLCAADLQQMEARLRYAQACDALEELRRQLRIRTYLNQFKVKNITGQRPNTQARGVQARVDNKVKAAANRYRRCRAAHHKLVGGGTWENHLRVLQDEDIRGLGDRAVLEQEEQEHSQSRRPLSWLWFAVGLSAENTDPGLHGALRVEWAKARARAKRWHEEVILIRHEMDNILKFCETKAARWYRCSDARIADGDVDHTRRPDDGLAEGLHAYASRQADMYARMQDSWRSLWVYVFEDSSRYLAVHPEVRYPEAAAAVGRSASGL
ncbi:hypothetical protein BV25DRAFT_1817015, partial [Artomyces pyxidatus]